MATFRITGPDGASYKIEAPDEAAALSAFQEMTGMATDAPKGDASKWSGGSEAVSSATFGMAIPITSALMTPLEMVAKGTANPVEAYRSIRDKQDADRAAWQEANPVGNIAANVAGGLAMGGTLAKGGATLAGRLGGGPAARIGEAVMEGALYGGATGLGEARGGVGEHLRSGAVGAGVGGAAGGVVAGGAQVLGAAGDGIVSAYRGRKDPQGYAARKVAQSLADDGKTAADVTSDLFNAPSGTTVADVAGENTRDLLRTVNNVRGPGRTAVAKLVDDRMAGQRDRLTQSVVDKLAPGRTGKIKPGELYNATLDDIVQTYRTGAAPLYERAYAKPVNYDDFELDKLVPRIPSAAWKEARELMQIEGYQPKQFLANISDDGSVSINRVPDMRQWDYVKRALDSRIAQEDGAGAIGGTTPKGRALTELKNELLANLDKANPSYKAARTFSSDQIGLKKALETGSKLLSQSPEDVAGVFAKMSKAEKEVARIGLGRALRDKIIAGKDNSDRVSAVWTPKTREILSKVFDKKAFEEFAAAMENEAAKMKTVNAARGNSTTARQLLAADDGGMDPSTVIQAAQGNVVAAALSALGRAARKLGGLNDKSAAAMSDFLLSGPGGKQLPLAAIEEAQRRITEANTRGVQLNPVVPRSLGLLGGGVFATPRDQR